MVTFIRIDINQYVARLMKFKPEVELYSTIDDLLHPPASPANSNDLDCLDSLVFGKMSHSCAFLLRIGQIYNFQKVVLLYKAIR